MLREKVHLILENRAVVPNKNDLSFSLSPAFGNVTGSVSNLIYNSFYYRVVSKTICEPTAKKTTVHENNSVLNQ